MSNNLWGAVNIHTNWLNCFTTDTFKNTDEDEDDPNFSLGNIFKLETSAALCDNLGFRNYVNYSTVGNSPQQMDYFLLWSNNNYNNKLYLHGTF